MADKINFCETGRAVLSPDVYGGESCDQIVPRWETESAGGKGDKDWVDVLELDARHFPPGTIVTIQEPECPECGTRRDVSVNPESLGEVIIEAKCDCGFDWEAWTQGEYS